MFVSPLSTLGRIVRQNSIRQNRQSRTSQALLAAACQTLRVAAMESLETRTLLSSVVLGPQLTYGIPGAPASIAAADLTGDGFKDIITANSNGTVSVLMNSGDGELSTATSISDGLSKSTGAYVTVAAGDFNGDGKTDLAISNGSDQVSILLGNGDGTFQSPKLTTLSANVDSLAVGDFNDDGHTDLAAGLQTTLSGHGVVAVLVGNNDGTFEAQQNTYVGTTAVTNVTVGDFNNTGNPDLVVGESNGTLFTLINNGSALGAPTQFYSVGTGKFDVVTGDVNNDGNTDIVLALPNGTIRVLLGNGNGTFAAALSTTVPTGIDPQGVALADLNGDGLPDLVAANYTGNTISVSLGNGDGSFQAAQIVSANTPSSTGLVVADLTGNGKPDVVTLNYSSHTVDLLLNTTTSGTFFAPTSTIALGNSPEFVTSADLTGNGLSDIVETNFNANTVEVFLANGDGTFKAPEVYSVANGPATIVIGDVNNDQIPDIVVASSGSESISVLLGNGNGTFKPAITSPVGFGLGRGPAGLALADINGDSFPDVVVAEPFAHAFGVMLGNGDGTFQTAVNHPLIGGNAEAYAVAVADLTGDGKLDVAVTDVQGHQVDVFLGNGDGTFSAPTAFAVGNATASIAVGDLNDDGHPDLVTANDSSQGSVSVLMGNGDGTFAAATSFPTAPFAFQAVIADVNSDGKPDIVTSNTGGGSGLGEINILPGNGDGTFGKAQIIPVGNYPRSVAIGDFEGDGKLDFVAANTNGNSLSVIINTSVGGFTFALPSANNLSGQFPASIATGDFNGDGNADLVVAEEDTDQIQVLLGNGDGTFRTAGTYTLADGYEPTDVLVGDVNGDGKSDIVALARGDGSGEIVVLPGNGDGTFGAPIITKFSGSFSFSPDAIAAADFNGDGKLDVALATGTDGTVEIFQGNGDGTFEAPVAAYSAANSSDLVAIAAGDLNNDGHPDLVVTNSFADTVDVLLNNGNGTFGTAHPYSVGNYPSSVTIADVNGDSKPDLITTNKYANTVSVLLGNGDGSFSAAQSFAAGSFPFSATGADLTANGKVDLIVANPGNSDSTNTTISVLPGNGDGTFGAPVTLSVGNYPTTVAVADFNGDGKPDIAVADAKSNSVDILLNSGGGVATTAQSASKVVTVSGSPQDDTASITYSGGDVIIDINGVSQSIAASGASGLVINLGAGDDSIFIGAGVPAVSVNGGSGNDTIVADNSAADTLAGAGGNDSIEGGSGADLILGGGGNDTLVGGGKGSQLLGNSGNDLIDATARHVTVVGGGGNDTLSGNGKRDSLRGGGGDDILLDGSTGNVPVGDTLNGGAGLNFAQFNPNDVFKNIFDFIDPQDPVAAPQSQVAPAAQTIQPADSVVTAAIINNKLKVVGTPNNDTIGVSFDGTNLIVSSAGSPIDTLPAAGLIGVRVNGGAGNDIITIDPSVVLPTTVVGGAGNDSITGGGGDNVLIGSAGNDTLVGGAGTNLLIPADRDTFENAPSGNDVLEGGTGYSIADFSYRTDPLKLRANGIANSGDVSAGEATTIDSNISAIWGGTGADTINGVVGGKFLSGGAGADSITGGGVGDVIVGGAGADTVVATNQPVSIFLRDGTADQYSGVTDAAIDILQIDSSLDVVG